MTNTTINYINIDGIKIDINKKDDLSFILEEKLSEILDKKAFRVDKISKKIPKLDLLDKDNNKESIVMYLVCISFVKISLLFNIKSVHLPSDNLI